jgi:hypothetical protein
MVSICSAVVLGAVLAPAAMAQSNPFVPPQSGMSRAQIEQIVRQEVERAKVQQAKSGTPGNPAVPGSPGGQTNPANSQAKGVNGLPQQQGGTPNANVASNAPQGGGSSAAAPVVDPVADLLKEGGVFVGCVGGTPVFKDKVGRRAYFTSKELRESNEARRFTRCG